MKNKDFFYLQLEKIFIENRMYMQPWFENAPSKEELIDRTKKELEDHMEGVYSISDDYIQKLLSIKNSHIAHYDGSKVEFEVVKDHIRFILKEKRIGFKSIKYEIGPTVTLYKIRLEDNVRMEKIHKIESDILWELDVIGVRVLAPLPRRNGIVGIEVPNKQPQPVTMHSIWNSSRWKNEEKMTLPMALGQTISGEVFMLDLVKTYNNILIAGDCGSGKSIAIKAMVNSLMRKVHPSLLKFVLMDPKGVEFRAYEKVSRSYLATMRGHENESPIITTWQHARDVLNSLMIEYQSREDLLIENHCSSIDAYNEKVSGTDKVKPHIVVVIDEFGDFVKQVGQKIETPLCHLSTFGASCGIHFIISTERPTYNIITGLIKASFWTRIAFRTSTILESKTVVDDIGAECLMGNGDMLYCRDYKLTRVQCGNLSKEEIESFLDEKAALYNNDIEPYFLPYCEVRDVAKATSLNDGTVYDPMIADVARLVVMKQKYSASYIQRTFEIGYIRATFLVQQLENMGVVGLNKSSKEKEVLVKDLDTLDKILHKFKIC